MDTSFDSRELAEAKPYDLSDLPEANIVAEPSPSSREEAIEVLRRVYGYSDFRPGQWEVISHLMDGRDVVVLMPTGGGKSICFQLPALMSQGCCLVVSPLIALMNDQVQALRANGIAASAVNSMIPEGENRATYEAAARGQLKLLYISPERLLLDLEGIARAIPVSFIAVDEAHCISQWGHDFRPVYTQLSRLKEKWPQVPVMALTATADRLTRDDISRALSLQEPYMHVGSFDRPNLSLQVITGSTLPERLRMITTLVDRHPADCGIVYCLSRRKTEQMAKKLQEAGVNAAAYHAGMFPMERERVQRDFVNGRLQAICATIAFGMGIDKSNVRWVVHNNIPGNIESYYQEIGRAGRDGLPAETILFYSYADILTRENFVEESGQKEINRSKLKFMQRYAEASVCRRRILLSYFSEDMDHDCGNCDNCRQPRPRFDATVLAQKALSAIVRVKGAEGLNTIIDILRGANRQELFDKRYHELPTYGAGRELSNQEWQAYILQMIQLGLIEVAYEEHFHLRPTDAGRLVLKGQRKVELTRYIGRGYLTTENSRRSRERIPEPSLTIEEHIEISLKSLRAELAEEDGIADYMVFSDATIAAIAGSKPLTPADLVGIEGMSLVRFAKYWKDILSRVRKILKKKGGIPLHSSDQVSAILFNHGLSPEAIATHRSLAMTTIIGHLMSEYNRGADIDIWRIVSKPQFESVISAIEEFEHIRPSDTNAEEITIEQRKSRSEEMYAYLLENHGISADLLTKVKGMRAHLK